ncbi:hypothetical protein F9C28_18205 [Shimwellia pseudoproteus]|uniref:winged helix-turn-helix domain-containing protein n=1 Tax=Shimwellia pseudoproteus TaxID=570012 RepID=UPI0018EB2B54|nr:winged helix-turn-helix domain-containing protein [Shimwellia pseudoproteus]MBJ3816784.1 hypothetical protein [Shimwellia pseudoproteus]
MPGKFLIDNLIVFDVDSRTLSLINRPSCQDKNNTRRVLLHTPTTHFLALLIERQGELLTLDDILNNVWKNRGIVVSPGAVYQNISLLRRAFVRLGLKRDIVMTLPRRGIILSHNIPVTPYSGSVALSTRLRISLGQRLAAVICVSMIILLAALPLHYQSSARNYMDSYHSVSTADPECHIFLNRGFPGNLLTNLLKNKVLHCSEQPYNYITAFHGVNRYSVISCEQDIRKPAPDCLSRFYQQDT